MTNRYLMAQKVDSFIVDTWPAVSANAHYIDAVSEGISGDRGFLNPETSAQRLKRNKIGGGISYGGEIQVPMYPRESTSLLYYLLGTCVTTGSAPSYEHALTMAIIPPNFIMAVGKDLKEHRFGACVMKSATIDYEANEVLLGSFDIMARNELISGDLQTVTFPDFNNVDRSYAGTEVETKIADTVVDYIESATIEMTNNIVDDNYVLGSRLLPKKYVQGFDISGSLSIAYDDYQRYQEFLNESSLKLALDAKYTGRGLETILPAIQLNTADLPTKSNDRFILEIDYMGERDSTDNAVYVNVTNNRSHEEFIA